MLTTANNATHALNISAGVSYPKVFPGHSFKRRLSGRYHPAKHFYLTINSLQVTGKYILNLNWCSDLYIFLLISNLQPVRESETDT